MLGLLPLTPRWTVIIDPSFPEWLAELTLQDIPGRLPRAGLGSGAALRAAPLSKCPKTGSCTYANFHAGCRNREPDRRRAESCLGSSVWERHRR